MVRKSNMAVAAVVACLLALLIHDVLVFKLGGRPFSATIDGICGIFITPRRDCIVAKALIESDRVKMNVAHRWRGNYQFKIWMPDVEGEKVPDEDLIGINCMFADETGKIVCRHESKLSKYLSWQKGHVGIPYGYAKTFRMYNAPLDVPLDKPLDVEVFFAGDIIGLLKSCPGACLLLVKERDK